MTVVNCRQGAQGSYDTASKASLASEFAPDDASMKDADVEDLALKTILKSGNLQTIDVSIPPPRCRMLLPFESMSTSTDAANCRCPSARARPTTP